MEPRQRVMHNDIMWQTVP